jgi:oligogalacturonide transport system ATP-binding protein
VDTPVALYERPANAFVAGFIGSPEMNLVKAELQALNGSAAVGLGGQVLPLSGARSAALAGRQGAITFGLRPEHIGALPRAQGDSLPVPATLRFTEHMGSEVYVHFNIGELPFSARVPVEQASGLHGLQRGAALTMHLQMGAAHLFDASSGLAVA